MVGQLPILWPKHIAGVWKRLLITMLMVFVLTTGVSNYCGGSNWAAADTTTTVTLTNEQADSLITLIDNQAYEIRSLKIDLWQVKSLAEIDSVRSAQLLNIQQEGYEEIIAIYKDERDNWLVKSLKHPAIWFILGAYAGLQVQDLQ